MDSELREKASEDIDLHRHTIGGFYLTDCLVSCERFSINEQDLRQIYLDALPAKGTQLLPILIIVSLNFLKIVNLVRIEVLLQIPNQRFTTYVVCNTIYLRFFDESAKSHKIAAVHTDKSINILLFQIALAQSFNVPMMCLSLPLLEERDYRIHYASLDKEEDYLHPKLLNMSRNKYSPPVKAVAGLLNPSVDSLAETDTSSSAVFFKFDLTLPWVQPNWSWKTTLNYFTERNIPGTFIFRLSESQNQTIVLSVQRYHNLSKSGGRAINFRFKVKDRKYIAEKFDGDSYDNVLQIITRYNPRVTQDHATGNQDNIFLNASIIPDRGNLTNDQANTVHLLKQNQFDLTCLHDKK
ncbi:uncharacterized protein TRIADDRAFT_57613 [Trichoplax adhaerens]|uniref:SH2 domain-containing protein n=1 Tax=Trichoplax adhaerens TaxID=10228 RepID=B3RZX9_TRIAD|nr:predicted protein [Trichoplax adhaerens]EDV24291.1 predicted protein [Trichoplax adhaerens]|eukprot:XP_002113817.1 predicted protein [Trichoplax adhaerens]